MTPSHHPYGTDHRRLFMGLPAREVHPNATKPPTCKCGSEFTIDDRDGVPRRCGVCGKRKP